MLWIPIPSRCSSFFTSPKLSVLHASGINRTSFTHSLIDLGPVYLISLSLSKINGNVLERTKQASDMNPISALNPVSSIPPKPHSNNHSYPLPSTNERTLRSTSQPINNSSRRLFFPPALERVRGQLDHSIHHSLFPCPRLLRHVTAAVRWLWNECWLSQIKLNYSTMQRNSIGGGTQQSFTSFLEGSMRAQERACLELLAGICIALECIINTREQSVGITGAVLESTIFSRKKTAGEHRHYSTCKQGHPLSSSPDTPTPQHTTAHLLHLPYLTYFTLPYLTLPTYLTYLLTLPSSYKLETQTETQTQPIASYIQSQQPFSFFFFSFSKNHPPTPPPSLLACLKADSTHSTQSHNLTTSQPLSLDDVHTDANE